MKPNTRETLQDFVLQGFGSSGFTVELIRPKTEEQTEELPKIHRDFVFSAGKKRDYVFSRGDTVDFSFADDVVLAAQQIFAAGFSSDVSGSLNIWNWQQYILPSGIFHEQFSRATLQNRNVELYPHSFHSLSFGRAKVNNVRHSIFPRSFDSLTIGQVNVSPRFIQVTGSSYGDFGHLTIVNANRELAVFGFHSQIVPPPKLTSMRREIYPRGADELAMGRFNRVEYRKRAIFPHSWESHVFRQPEISGGVRSISPSSLPFMVAYAIDKNRQGWANGEQNIPVNKTINETYTVWSYGLIGVAAIANKNQSIKPIGFTHEVVSSPYIAEPTQYIETIGVDLLAMGYVYRDISQNTRTWDKPDLSTWQKNYWKNKSNWTSGLTVMWAKRPIFTKGNDVQEMSNALIAYRQREMIAGGLDSAVISPKHTISDTKRRIERAGSSQFTVFGHTQIINKHSKTIDAKGFLSDTYGKAFIQNTRISTQGFDTCLIGKPKILDGLFHGFDSLNMGHAWVSHSIRAISPISSDFQAIGQPEIGLRVLDVPSIKHSGVFGDVLIQHRSHSVFVQSINEIPIGKWTRIELQDVSLSIGLGEQFAAGLPTVENKLRTIYPQGIEWQKGNGIAWVSERVRSVLVGLGVLSQFGKAAVSKYPIIEHKGFDGIQFGQPEINNRNQYVFTGNIYPPAMGLPTIDFFNRTIQLDEQGLDVFQSGDTWVSHWRRRIFTQGTDNLFIGKAWVSQGARLIEPIAIEPPDFRQPKLGYTQYIAPESWDSSAFGTRIIPELQRIEFENGIHALDFGLGNVFNHLQKTKPFSFETQDRFGWAFVWNTRQYIYPIHDDLGGTTPPVLAGRTHILNRNRHIGAIGIHAPSILEPLVYLNARVIAPNGLDSLAFGKHMIAFRIRSVLPENWDSLITTRWGVVYNAARVIEPIGFDGSQFRQPEIVNTRRYYRWVSAGEQTEWGLPMVDFAVRHIIPYQGIKPDYYLPAPTVHMMTRMIGVKGFNSLQFGKASLAIHWNKIAPRFPYRELFGWAEVCNVTPELHFKGADMADFGAIDVQLLTRYVQPETVENLLIGKPHIGDRNKKIQPNTTHLLKFGQHKIWHLTTPVNYSRVIYPGGIPSDFDEVGRHTLRDNIIRPSGIASIANFGKHEVRSNIIHVEIGIGNDNIGNHKVELSRRTIQLHEKGIMPNNGLGKPILSPLTIWATHDTPIQAKNNHQGDVWHDVDDWQFYQTGKLGKPTISQFSDIQLQARGSDTLQIGSHSVELSCREIAPTGFLSFRMGWVVVSDGVEEIEQVESVDFAAVGYHRVAFPISRNQTIQPHGVSSNQFGKQEIQLFNRNITPKSWDSRQFGYSRGTQNDYMPQSLCVYFPKPVLPENWDSAEYGKVTVSLFIRTIEPVGFDNFLMEYDLMKFNQRMRVSRGKKTMTAQTITVNGADNLTMGMNSVANKAHFIRPDGFADMYHKGVASV